MSLWCSDLRIFRPGELARPRHCESCRRNTGSPFTTWFGVPRTAFRFTGKPPTVYRSSPGARRMFCSTCGTPMTYEHDRYPGEIHLYAVSLDDPRDFQPQCHVHYAERVPWITLGDTLPRFDRGSNDE